MTFSLEKSVCVPSPCPELITLRKFSFRTVGSVWSKISAFQIHALLCPCPLYHYQIFQIMYYMKVYLKSIQNYQKLKSSFIKITITSCISDTPWIHQVLHWKLLNSGLKISGGCGRDSTFAQKTVRLALLIDYLRSLLSNYLKVAFPD